MQAKSKSQSSAKSVRRKQPRQNNSSIRGKTLLILIEIVALLIAIFLLLRPNFDKKVTPGVKISKFSDILNKKYATPTPAPTPPPPTPTPTPKPLTFEEMNTLYGPCVKAPVLMYHHIQSKESAQASGQTGLSVYTDIFASHVEYLKSKNYSILHLNDLINFFDSGTPLSPKPVFITFDDGYQDFYTDAYPVLSGSHINATVFLPTGLMENPGYLTWAEVGAMKGLILFGNHTWSHKTVRTQVSVMQNEIATADTQLAERSLNSPKIFAYPYGPDSSPAENFLSSLNYKIAFTTRPGSVLCKKQRLNLPRIRIGNLPLSSYGF